MTRNGACQRLAENAARAGNKIVNCNACHCSTNQGIAFFLITLVIQFV